MPMCRQITALYFGENARTSAARQKKRHSDRRSRHCITRYQKMDAEILGDKQGEVKVKALLNALVHTLKAIDAD